MKRYSLNRNFIPKGFVIKKKYEEESKNKRGILILAILSIILMPSTIKFIGDNFSVKEEKYKTDEVTLKDNSCNDESFYWWMDIINNDTVGTFNNVNASIYIDSMDKLYEILQNKNIEVESVDQFEDEKIEVRICKVSR